MLHENPLAFIKIVVGLESVDINSFSMLL